MISPATADALGRISDRAQDVLRAYTAGARGTRGDVNLNTHAPEPASDPLSVAAPPNAYFALQGADGTRSFTRDGGFQLAGNRLVAADGTPVLGYTSGDARGTVPAPLALPANDAALGRCGDVRIESDGTLAYTRSAIDPRTHERSVERVAAGKLALARFPAGTQPVSVDGVRVTAPAGIPPHLGTPADGTFAGIATYSRDVGGVDIDASLRKLSEAYLAFAALHAAQKAHGYADKTVMDLIK